MNHSTHNLELLAAHASGHEPDRAAAETLLSTCDECRLVYEEQVQMRSMLARAGYAHLSASEQAQLAAAIGAARPGPARSFEARRAQPKTLNPIWGRVMAAAAAMAVVVGVGATIASQQGGDLAATTTVAADTAAAPEFATGGAENGERAPATTAASAEATLYQLEAAGDLDRLKAEAEALSDETTAQDSAALDAQCAEETEDLTVSARGESTYQERAVLLLLAEEDGDLLPRAFFTDNCSEIPLP
ncbi:MAG: hypothetical protein ACRDWA_04495 [Acidimicrobiia bacterium]